MQTRIVPLLVCVLVWSGVARGADWTEPKDGVYTEKQLTSFIQCYRDNMQAMAAAQKAAGGNSGAAAIAIMTQLNATTKANLAKYGLQEGEYQWLLGQSASAYSAAIWQDQIKEGRAQLDANFKKNQDELKAKQQSLAQYEKAAKDGRRVMSKDEREAAIKSAKDDQQSALDEAKQHADEAKAAKEEADKADAEAKQNDTLAKNPPSDVSADDRPGYIEEKKTAAEAARTAAKEARDKQAEALKAEKEARTKADGFASRIKDPELPLTDEEKAQAKQQNQDMIKQLKDEIDATQQAMKFAQGSQQDGFKQLDDMVAKVPPANLTLMNKHRAEWETALGVKK
ncbi:MAG TPA: hypothetical protein VH370_24220 [Humisphaera sp.]|jgi:hypothetical protein|nr:hypothetical protein [Humisphaera sp.]